MASCKIWAPLLVTGSAELSAVVEDWGDFDVDWACGFLAMVFSFPIGCHGLSAASPLKSNGRVLPAFAGPAATRLLWGMATGDSVNILSNIDRDTGIPTLADVCYLPRLSHFYRLFASIAVGPGLY
jgi:hypothetical protein